MPARHNPDNLQCDRDRRCLQTTRKNLLGSASGILSATIHGNGVPAPSSSNVTFFVNLNSGATISHGVPHKPSQFVASHASFTGCPIHLLPRTTPFLVTLKTAPVLRLDLTPSERTKNHCSVRVKDKEGCSDACKACARKRRGACLCAPMAAHKTKVALRALPGSEGLCQRGDAPTKRPGVTRPANELTPSSPI